MLFAATSSSKECPSKRATSGSNGYGKYGFVNVDEYFMLTHSSVSDLRYLIISLIALI